MKKRIVFILAALVLMAAALAGTKLLQFKAMAASAEAFKMPPQAVTAAPVRAEDWEPRLTAVGTLAAVQGVTITAEVAGKVTAIAFEAGSRVAAGQVLVRQDTSAEESQLRGAEASAELARTTLARNAALLKQHTISQAEYDTASAQFTETAAQADNLRAVIAKKTIRAPFAGRLGVRQVNLGQVADSGTPIVTLQALDPIYVDFTLPQQQLPLVRPGQPVRLSTDAAPGREFTGEVTVVNPLVDPSTRSAQVRATLANPGEALLPGMFANVTLALPARERVLAVPATAVLYAPYSDSVFVVDEKPGENGAPAGRVLRQQFVKLGEKRGDFVAVTQGLKEGELVASTGVFKLRNGLTVTVDNALAPDFSLAPAPADN
ncbi:MAG: efflux RND transporter periplasmic adaptor subunit [Thermodesulfobacteriota bacterium]